MEKNEIEKDMGTGKQESNTNFVPGKPYSNLRRDLTDEDLSNPAVQKLLINEIDKLEVRISDLKMIESKYHDSDKTKAVLEEKLKTHNSLEILYSFCLAIGSSLLGLASMFKFKDKGWIFLIAGGILIIGGILSKYFKK